MAPDRCPSCRSEVDTGAKFCGECGAELGKACPSCGSRVSPTAKFCSECGARQEPAAPPEPTAPPRQESAGEAERRQLTVMFCDLADSTALSGALDPEELREVLRAYQQRTARVIEDQKGHIAQYLGDGILAYFGYPVAYEDAAVRAVRAGLEVTRAIERLDRELDLGGLQHRLSVRIGIHSGLVVVGDVGGGRHREQLALGETPNIAARAQGQAAPDSVVITEATRRLIEGFFELDSLGSRELKGVAKPTTLYRVATELDVRSRFEASAGAGLSRLVGRDQELALLEHRCRMAREGQGQVVLLSGEAGIGKSRIVRGLTSTLDQQEVVKLTYRCSPDHTQSPLYPVIDNVRRQVDRWRSGTDQGMAAALRELADETGLSDDELAVPLLASLLGLELPGESDPLEGLTPKKQGELTQGLLVRWVIEAAARRPVVAICEDLHWADPSTLELIERLIDEVATLPVLVLLTFRFEFTPTWSQRSYMSQIALNRLDRTRTEELVTSVAGDCSLPEPVIDELVAKTDGVPLFVEELTRMILESGLLHRSGDRYQLEGELPPLAIPATLQDSLMARLDRMQEVKELAQLGATIGRQFPLRLIRLLSGLPEERLARDLDKLVDAEVLFTKRRQDGVEYIFKHALIRDAAYESLLKSTRRGYHGRIADTMVREFADTVQRLPEVVAQHYTEAGQLDQAIAYWQQAGETAAARSANVEAVNHLQRALELVEKRGPTEDSVKLELTLLSRLGALLIATRGHGAPEVDRAYTRAWDLCRREGEDPSLLGLHWGLFLFFMGRARLQEAHELGAQLQRLAHLHEDHALNMPGHQARGSAEVFLGLQESAIVELDRAIALAVPEHRAAHQRFYGIDAGEPSCLAYSSWCLWLLGRADQSLERIERARRQARKLGSPFSLARARVWGAWLHQFRREPERVQEQAEAAIRLARDEQLLFWIVAGSLIRGWAIAQQGDTKAGLEELNEGIGRLRAFGVEIGMPYYLGLRADLLAAADRPDAAMAALDEALALMERTSERFWKAELHRQRAELLRQRGDGEAGSEFQRALEVAGEQKALALQLRAALGLARYRLEAGDAGPALQRLADLHAAFTEGLDTPDLVETRALLDQHTARTSPGTPT